MNRPRAWFGVLALVSALVSFRIALIPVGILLGKITEPSAALLFRVFGTEVLPIVLPGAVLLLLAWRRCRGGKAAWQWLALLAAAPLACAAIFLLVPR